MKLNTFSKNDVEKLQQAIANAECNTSSELKVHVEKTCDINVMERTITVFNQLGMDKTKLRNGVLIYLAIESKQFAIIGDSGINEVVDNNFWEMIKDKAIEHFKTKDFTGGLLTAIDEIGIALKHFFPYSQDDVNELTDEISFGDK